MFKMSQMFGNGWAQEAAPVGRWGHAGPRIIVAILGTMGTLAVLPLTFPPGGKPLVSLTFIVLMLVTFSEMRKHDRGLCERCMADFPLNPAESAQTYSHRLEVVHLLAEKRIAVRYLVAIVVACLLPLFAPDPLQLPAKLLWLASLVTLVYVVQSGVTHRRLQPWCPQCGPQGGTDKIETPEPMPMGGRSN